MRDVIIAQTGETLKQVGVMALRKPNGDFLESQPIYAVVNSKDIDSQTGMTKLEQKNLDDISAELGRKFKQYTDECKRQGLPI